jgi:hypothetical protein
VLYLPSNREVQVDLKQMRGSSLTARWYDPADGGFAEVSGSPFRAQGTQSFRPKAANAAGYGDWVLLLESTSKDSATAGSSAQR